MSGFMETLCKSTLLIFLAARFFIGSSITPVVSVPSDFFDVLDFLDFLDFMGSSNVGDVLALLDFLVVFVVVFLGGFSTDFFAFFGLVVGVASFEPVESPASLVDAFAFLVGVFASGAADFLLSGLGAWFRLPGSRPISGFFFGLGVSEPRGLHARPWQQAETRWCTGHAVGIEKKSPRGHGTRKWTRTFVRP
ncbi:hypothetical protein NLG97_g8688 [Lecanicillium saksenae]|uniref:Uncharacterized protein n=1 Tax=Lecanicillium saksenae TaxID=468837 RepID=A0ACC1QK57_9HYPO|nr:hypothetical protein NLG97_g8688 [Lecanicillium saksenae]